MQNYDTKTSRNVTSNAGASSGVKPAHVNVGMTGGAKTPECKPGSKAGKTPAGFAGGVLPGKV